MTHDEMIGYLRNINWTQLSRQNNAEIADRLDRYRDLLRRCEWLLPCSALRPDIEVLQRDIQEAIK